MAKNISVVKNKVDNKTYWQQRAEKTYLEGEKDALKIVRHLKSIYKETSDIIDNKIYSFYGKYARDNELTFEEAKQLLNKDQLNNFRNYIDKIIQMGDKNNFSSDEMKEFKRLYTKAKITRLEELQTNIRAELDKLAVKTIDNINPLLQDTYEDGYYKTLYNIDQAGITYGGFSELNKKAIEKAISTKYSASNYSLSSIEDGIWTSTNKLMDILTNEIPKGLVLGYNPNKLAREVTSKRVNKTLYNNTVRLVRTEYSNILNQATLDGYKEAGIEKYQILATLDMRTCDDCGEFDNKIVPIKDGETGVNLPPFHPNCRCTTIPYFEPDEYDIPYNNSYSVHDEKIYKMPLDITYKEWKDNLQNINEKLVYYGEEVKDILKMPEDYYTKDVIKIIANETNKLANKYTGTKSAWNGDIIIDNKTTPGMQFNGKIRTPNLIAPSQLLHEQLHAHSAILSKEAIWQDNKNIEEAVVDLLTREICKQEGLTIISSKYDRYIDALIGINDIIEYKTNNLKLAQAEINIKLEDRYKELKNRVDKYIKKYKIQEGTIEYAQLQDYLDTLKGSTIKEDNLLGILE